MAIDRDTDFSPRETTTTCRSLQHAADRELELE
jgi:hypothetical protein